VYQAKLANLMEVANGAPNNAGAVVPDIPRHRFGSGDNTQLDHPILGDRIQVNAFPRSLRGRSHSFLTFIWVESTPSP
jgi:hypothetical protein